MIKMSSLDALQAAVLELQLAGLSFKIIDNDSSSYSLQFADKSTADKAFELLMSYDSLLISQIENIVNIAVDNEFSIRDKRRALFCRLSGINFESLQVAGDTVVAITDNQLSDFEHLKSNVFVKAINLKN